MAAPLLSDIPKLRMHIEDLLEKLNPHGRYQITAWVLLAIFNCFPPAWHSFSIPFIGYYPNGFTCVFEHELNATSHFPFNATQLSEIGHNDTDHPHCLRPKEINIEEMKEPSEYSLLSTIAPAHSIRGTILVAEPCPVGSFKYSAADPITSSIVTEFDLVCNRHFIFVLISAAEGIGEILGCVLFGWLADFIGRRKAYFLSAITLFISGIGCGLSPNWMLVLVARIVIGAGRIGMNNTGFVFASEMFPPKQRTIFAILHELVWGAAVVSVVGIGYYVRDWRQFCYALTIPILFVLPLWWYVKESLHWLLYSHATPEARRRSLNLHAGNLEEADKVIKYIANYNNVKLPANATAFFLSTRPAPPRPRSRPDDLAATSDPDVPMSWTPHNSISSEDDSRCCFSDSKSRGGPMFLRLFATPRVRFITVTVTLLWFANSLAYYGLQWSAQMLRADFYMSYFLLAVVELPSTLIVLLIMPRIGRRWTIFGFHVIAGICCIIVPFIPQSHSDLAVATAIFGKFAVCSSFTSLYPRKKTIFLYGVSFFSALYIFAVELFPTEIRGLGFGFCSLLGRIGLVAAPFVNWLGFSGEATAEIIRMLLYGIVLVVVSLLIIPLPETNNCPLADTIEQTEHFAEYCEQVKNNSKENERAYAQKDHEDHAL